MSNSTATEVDNRMQAAWATFARLRHILCNRRIGFACRQRLFDAVVTPTALYGAAAWTLTLSLENLLEKTRRRMLRKMLMLARGTTED